MSPNVRALIHLLLLRSGRNAASTPETNAKKMKAASVASQLLDRHQGRNDQVRDTSVAAGQVDAQKQSPKTHTPAIRPVMRPTTAPFLRFGYIRRLSAPNDPATAAAAAVEHTVRSRITDESFWSAGAVGVSRWKVLLAGCGPLGWPDGLRKGV